MIMPRVSNMAWICAQMPTPGLSCSLEWLCFRSSLVWCKNPKNNEFRTKKFLNQEFLYGIPSFCIFSENNSFLHGKISCFCIFLKMSAVHTKLAEFFFRLLLGQEVDAMDSLFFGGLDVLQGIIQEYALFCLQSITIQK